MNAVKQNLSKLCTNNGPLNSWISSQVGNYNIQPLELQGISQTFYVVVNGFLYELLSSNSIFLLIEGNIDNLLWLSPDKNFPTRSISHDDVIKWKHFPRYWPFVRGIPRSPVNSPHKGQWRGALMFTLICARINDWVNNREAGDLRRHHGHNDVIVMIIMATLCLPRYLGKVAHTDWTKWPPFHRRYIQMCFLEWKCMNFTDDFTEICSLGSY